MITQEYVPFHKVIKLIQDFADRHISINSFGFGNLLDYGKDIEDRDNLYPVLFVVPQNASYDENMTDYNISVIIADRLSDDLDNRISVISNMSMIAKDLIGEIKLGDLQEYFDVPLPISSNMFIERFMDNVGGVQITLPLQTIDPINVCENFLTPTIIQPQNVENLFAWYDLQDDDTITLSGGTTIIELRDKSNNFYDLTPIVEGPIYSASTEYNTLGFKGFVDYTGNTMLSTTFPSIPAPTGMTIFSINDSGRYIRNVISIQSGTTYSPLTIPKYGFTSLDTNTILSSNGLRTSTGPFLPLQDNPLIYSFRGNIDGITTKIFYPNGEFIAPTSSSTTGTTTPTIDTIIISDDGGLSNPPRLTYEIISYDRILSDEEYNGVLEYLKDKYNYYNWI